MKNKTASHIKKDELDIIDGALRFRDVHVCDVMTPLDNVFAISLHEMLSYETLEYISKAGFSKIPVFDGKKQDIVGLVYTKDLMFVNPEENVSVKEIVKLHGHKLLSFWYDENLSDVLSIFRREEEEIAFVRDVYQEDEMKDPIYCIRGIVTVEDIIEEIFGRKLWNLSLSDWEVQMISEYIMKNVPQIERYYERKIIPKLSLASTVSFDKYSFLSSRLYDLVKQSEVCFMKRSTTQSISKPLVTASHSNPSTSHSTLFTALTKISSYSFNGSNNAKSIVDYAEDDIIIRSGRFLDHYIVVLQGQVKLIYDDTAHSEEIFGPWSIIGADVLISGANTYSPHFTVIIHSRQVKFIRIKPFKIIKQQSSEESSGATYLHTIAEEGSEDRDDTHVPPLLPSSPPLNGKKSSIVSNPLLLRFQLNYRHKQSGRSAHAMTLDSYQLKDKYPATPNTLLTTNSEKKATARKISPVSIKASEKEALVPLLKASNTRMNEDEEEDLEWNGDSSNDGTQASSLLSMKRLSKERKKNKSIQQHDEEEWTVLNPIVEDSHHNDNDIILQRLISQYFSMIIMKSRLDPLINALTQKCYNS